MNKPLNASAVLAEIHHFIGGAEVAGKSGRHGDVYNPALGIVKARVPFASEAEVSAAVEAAVPIPSCRALAISAASGWPTIRIGRALASLITSMQFCMLSSTW